MLAFFFAQNDDDNDDVMKLTNFNYLLFAFIYAQATKQIEWEDASDDDDVSGKMKKITFFSPYQRHTTENRLKTKLVELKQFVEIISRIHSVLFFFFCFFFARARASAYLI